MSKPGLSFTQPLTKKATEWIKAGEIQMTNRSSHVVYIVYYKVFLSMQSAQDNTDKSYSDQTINMKIDPGDTQKIPLILGDIFQSEIRNGGEVLCRVMVKDLFEIEYWSDQVAIQD